jgi:hypothetical protein
MWRCLECCHDFQNIVKRRLLTMLNHGVFNSCEVMLHCLALKSASKGERILLLTLLSGVCLCVCLQWKHVASQKCLENAWNFIKLFVSVNFPGNRKQLYFMKIVHDCVTFVEKNNSLFWWCEKITETTTRFLGLLSTVWLSDGGVS